MTPFFDLLTESTQRLVGLMSRPHVKRDAAQCAAFSSAITLTRGTVLELCTTWLSKLRLAGVLSREVERKCQSVIVRITCS